MRTPNCHCILCEKPLYRRQFELVRIRYAACLNCRDEAKRIVGLTDEQQAGLALGRQKWTAPRATPERSEEARRKCAESIRLWCLANPDKVVARSEKIRGERHYAWNGGANKLNTAIRQMTENRKWMDAVKERDGKCVRCGSTEQLESHHKVELSVLINRFGICSCEDARKHAAELWDIDNGLTLCEGCHYGEHGRTRREAA